MGAPEDRYAVLSWTLSRTGTRGRGEESRDLDLQVTMCEIPGVQRSWFRWRCTRNVDKENNSNNDQSPARDLRVYHRFSFIVFCHDIDRSTAGCAGVMQASQLVTARSCDRSPRSRAREHMPAHRARQASPFSRPGRVRLSGAGPKVFRKGQWRIAVSWSYHSQSPTKFVREREEWLCKATQLTDTPTRRSIAKLRTG